MPTQVPAVVLRRLSWAVYKVTSSSLAKSACACARRPVAKTRLVEISFSPRSAPVKRASRPVPDDERLDRLCTVFSVKVGGLVCPVQIRSAQASTCSWRRGSRFGAEGAPNARLATSRLAIVDPNTPLPFPGVF